MVATVQVDRQIAGLYSTSGCNVVEVVRLSSHHNFIADDSVAVDVSALCAAT